MILTCFVSGVSAEWHTNDIHELAPYWMAIPLLIQAALLMLAVRSSKRAWLAIAFIFFFIFLIAMCAFLIISPYRREYSGYECYVQKNNKEDKTRCACSADEENYFIVKGAKTAEPCYRAYNILVLMSNICYALGILCIVPQMCLFVLLCNDLCCLSCRRSAMVPQVVIATGNPQNPSMQTVPVQTVTYRTDEQPTTSTGETDQAGPLPEKRAGGPGGRGGAGGPGGGAGGSGGGGACSY